MTKSIFYSFHYSRDSWRVMQVMKMGAIESQPLLNPQEWEEVKRKGDSAIQDWINKQMAYKKAVVVLVGAETATRRWVLYEIEKAWNDKRPLVGIRIHGLADQNRSTDNWGPNPFAELKFNDGSGSLADYITLHDPVGRTSQEKYGHIAANIGSWVDNAYKNG